MNNEHEVFEGPTNDIERVVNLANRFNVAIELIYDQHIKKWFATSDSREGNKRFTTEEEESVGHALDELESFLGKYPV